MCRRHLRVSLLGRAGMFGMARARARERAAVAGPDQQRPAYNQIAERRSES